MLWNFSSLLWNFSSLLWNFSSLLWNFSKKPTCCEMRVNQIINKIYENFVQFFSVQCKKSNRICLRLTTFYHLSSHFKTINTIQCIRKCCSYLFCLMTCYDYAPTIFVIWSTVQITQSRKNRDEISKRVSLNLNVVDWTIQTVLVTR